VSEESKRGRLDRLVITTAEDLEGTDFACMTADADWARTPLKFDYDSDLKTLSISTPSGDAIKLEELRDIHYGNSLTEVNMCNLTAQYHTINGAEIDLSGKQVNFTMISDQLALPDV